MESEKKTEDGEIEKKREREINRGVGRERERERERGGREPGKKEWRAK